MIDDLTFLEEGRYTARTDIVRSISEGLTDSDNNPWSAISDYIFNMRDYKNWLYISTPFLSQQLKKRHNERVFRKRTASEILESGYVTGCTDRALVFLVLARELGIPARYVETFEEQWLHEDTRKIKGHIFVDIFVYGQWRAYEPIKGFIKDNVYTLSGNRYIEVGKGLDFSEVYIKEDGEYRLQPINLQCLDMAVRIFKPQTVL